MPLGRRDAGPTTQNAISFLSSNDNPQVPMLLLHFIDHFLQVF